MRVRTALCSAASALSALALLTACGGSGSTTASSSDKPLIGVDYPRSDTDFWNSYIKYTPEYAKELGLSLKTTNSQNDVAKLTANAQTFISQGVKGLAMAPQDTAAIAPTLAQLEAKKIPVVTVDTRPDSGNVYMVVRADNRAYGEKACQYLGTKLGGKGKVVMLQGGLDSINGRDRTDAFNECMKKDYPDIKVFGEATNWDGAVAAQKLQTDLTANPDIKGIYMQSSFALSGTLQVLKQKGLLVDPKDKKHVFVVSNDGIPEELKSIAEGKIDATVSQPADLYAKYALYYLKAAIDGKTFKPGKTDHGSTIVQVREGLLEDQLSAPLVTADGGTYGGVPSLKSDDTSLWGNNLG
ncbi:sugar ABC transporter substrate-binding protein [Streptomyces europaeiscabiei]|uniref:sugar ABC transporter substrate-binding protein n=1 Tax=Streptomyces europaeiscabiei TaxID=146819 RepID=UPI0006283214|nr:sugar ABC transporter substrate-binding protein [Streptomyces europaeiscabiei]MDX2524299.1 sugar ABC transporter substrate-binding protein [Streptomyces europaeiscabiei]MDX2757594.1 sugar ABC transporter substrate-binding protein [Streptomyces europaeiscabiei]MDX2767135.1 sugar ABC transporter substrate-binding protein [Streptomyces europaeiscabiei]MDX3670766.1 sugar ABC transporter substrate-binding protein [Streptomyces europaeiscabiei]MDX3710564.1 sugar ABC transporter substrate-binding 